MPTTPISCPNSGSIRAASRPTPCRTPRSAASAARRACWRSSASSTPSPGISASIRSTCARPISTAPGATSRPTAKPSKTTTSAPRLIEQLERSSNYRARRNEIAEFNARSPILKRGIALTPVKFGISFTLTHLNQAGALVHVYQDGSVHLNHGGTEMGQGLFQKVAQVAAEEFGIGLDRVHITATSTDKVPNTSRHRRIVRHRPERHGGAARRARNQGAADALCQRDLERLGGSHRLPRRPRVHRQRKHSVRRIDQESLWRARASVGGRLLQDAEAALGPRNAAKAGRSSITPTARRAAKS